MCLLASPCSCALSQAYLPQYRDPRALGPPRGAPEPYVLYDARRVQDKVKMHSEGAGVYTYIMYIPGVPGEDTGEPPCVLFTDEGDWRLDKMTVHGAAYKTLALSPPETVELTALAVSLDPPSSGPRRIPRTIRLTARGGYRPLAGHLLPCPLRVTHPHLFGSAADLYARVAADLRPQTTRVLSDRLREYRLIHQWQLPQFAAGQAAGACVVVRYAESAYDKWTKRTGTPDGACPPAAVQQVMLRGCAAGYSALWPTLAARATNMPILLHPLGFAPLQLTATMMGYDTDDPLIQYLLTLDHEVAHRLLCQGGANHTWASLFHTLRSASPLATKPCWGVRSLFSGADTFLSALRHIGQDYALLSAGDDTEEGRAAIRAVHPAIPIQTDSTVVSDTCAPDLTLLGFPCPPYSILNQNITEEKLADSVETLRSAFEHVRRELPAVVVMENLPTLLTSRFTHVFNQIEEIIFSAPYEWMLGTLCPSMDGATITRPRLVWVGFRV